jgi:hypothetical protein
MGRDEALGITVLTDTDTPQVSEARIRGVPPWLRGKAVAALLPVVLLPISLVLWLSSVGSIDMAAMNDFGLVSVLPATIWAALILLILSFAVCWRRSDSSGALLALHIVLFIVLFYGIPAVAGDSPRGPIVYRHAGITEYLTRTGIVNTKQDAYFNWPGFFMGLGWTVKIGGISSALVLGKWATVAVNLMYLPPLLMLLRALTRNFRLIWAAALLFFILNWVNQDYLAPQSITYVFYLTILTLALTYLRPFDAVDSAQAPGSLRTWVKGSLGTTGDEGGAGRWSRWLPNIRPGAMPHDVPKTAVGGTTGVLVAMTVIVLFGAAVTSHQLTPYAVFSAVTLLVITGHCRVRGLPVLMAVILVSWTIFVASGYIDGHLEKIATGSGLKTSAASNVTGRLVGSDQHVIIVWERVVLAATTWLLALAGAFYRFRTRHRDHAAAILAVAPLPLFLLPYGGEVLMRIYFFMLPFVAFFAATLFVPDATEALATRSGLTSALRRARDVILFGGIASLLMVASFVARYGNERMDYFTPNEIAAVSELYRLAPRGSWLLAEVGYLPWRYQDYEWSRTDPSQAGHRYLSLAQEWKLDPTRSARDMALWTSETLRDNATAGRPPGFLILSRSQRAHEEILGGLSQTAMDDYERILVRSGKFKLVYANEDAKIYARIPESKR